MELNNLAGTIWALEESYFNRMSYLAMSKPEVLERMAAQVRDRTEPYFTARPSLAIPQSGSVKAASSSSYHHMVPKVVSKNGLIAVIPIDGVMTREGDFCSWGTLDLTEWILEASNDPDVSGIVLAANSGGGDASGIEIFDAAVKQCKKPVIGYVGNAAYSGANWALAHCNEIVMESKTISGMGSIGVYTMHVDFEKHLENEGVNAQMIRARGSENKALSNMYEALPEAAKKDAEDNVTKVRETFVKAVKSGRPGVDEIVFDGKTFNGTECIKYGLANSIGFLGDAIARADKLG